MICLLCVIKMLPACYFFYSLMGEVVQTTPTIGSNVEEVYQVQFYNLHGIFIACKIYIDMVSFFLVKIKRKIHWQIKGLKHLYYKQNIAFIFLGLFYYFILNMISNQVMHKKTNFYVFDFIVVVVDLNDFNNRLFFRLSIFFLVT